MNKKATGVFNQAIKTIQQLIDDDDQKGLDILCEIAEMFAKNRESKNSIIVFEQALSMAQTMKNYNHSSYILARIAELMIKAGESDKTPDIFDQAVQMIQKIDDDHIRFEMFITITEDMVDAGYVNKAVKTAKHISNYEDRSNLLICIASQIDEGESEKAIVVLEQAVKSIQNVKNQNRNTFEILEDISMEMTKRGKVKNALQTAKKISDERRSLNAFHSIADAMD